MVADAMRPYVTERRLRRVRRDAPRTRARAPCASSDCTFPELAAMTVDECAGDRRRLASSRRARRRSCGISVAEVAAASPFPRRPSASDISRSTAAPTRSRAARRSASAWRPSSARTCAAPATCSTSRPSGSTRATTRCLLESLRTLVERRNTVLVVEHDEATIAAADLVVDLGPGAGRDGGAARRRRDAGGDRGRSELAHGPLPARAARARPPGASPPTASVSRSTTRPRTI